MPLFRKSMLVLLLIVAVAGGAAFYGMQSQRDAVVLDAAETPAAQEAAGITVYVTGAVQQPGVVSVAAGARTADAVNACGGLLPQADAEKVNMAQPLKDGQQIRVPEKKAAGAASGSAAVGKEEDGRVNLNTADAKTLDTLPGVGPATAQKIIDYRESEGGFQSPEDLMKIKGIGQAKYEKLKDKVTI